MKNGGSLVFHVGLGTVPQNLHQKSTQRFDM